MRKRHTIYSWAAIQHLLRDRQLKAVAEGAGVSYSVLRHSLAGRTAPSYDTVERLSAYLDGREISCG